MAEEITVSKRQLGVFLLSILLIGGIVWTFWDEIQQFFKPANVTAQLPTQKVVVEKQIVVEKETAPQPKPVYPIGEVRLSVIDAIDERTGLSGIEVSVYEMGVSPRDPNARTVDSGITDANGVVSFTGARIFTETDYQYVAKGDTIYDVIEVRSVPAPAGITDMLTIYHFPEPMRVYKVGGFLALGTDLTINVTKESGENLYEFDITIGESVAGAIVKSPRLILRVPDDKVLPDGCVKSLFLIYKSGTDFGLPLEDIKHLIDGEPLVLRGTYGDYLTINDKGVVTVRLTVNNDLCGAGAGFQIVVDDLGGYKARDIASVSGDYGATLQALNINWVA